MLDKLTIVGVGMLGASVGFAAKQRQIVRTVVGVDQSPQHLARAQRDKYIDAGASLKAGVANANLVVVCTPVNTIAELVRKAVLSCSPGTVLTDVGSTKARIVDELASTPLPEGVEFVGSHPLAGSEKEGPQHANADLFANRKVIVTPSGTSGTTLECVRDFWTALGAEVIELDPVEHDRIVASTSHLPHLASSALTSVVPNEYQQFVATGFESMSRLAGGNAKLWSAIFESNRENLLAALSRYRDKLDEFYTALESADYETLAQLLERGKEDRRYLTQK